jgi:hypothetical protein
MKTLAILVYAAVLTVEMYGGEIQPPPDPPVANKEIWEI